MNEQNDRRLHAWGRIIACLVVYLLAIGVAYDLMAYDDITVQVGIFSLLTITVTAFVISLLVIFKPFQK